MGIPKRLLHPSFTETSRTSRPRRLMILLVSAALYVSAPSSVAAQCDEPDDDRYVELMEEANTAIEADDFEAALAPLIYAAERYDTAIVHYSLARAYHRLDRFAEAAEEYREFREEFQLCPDPHDLSELADQYLRLALEQDLGRQETAHAQTGISIPGLVLGSTGGALILGGLIFDLANMGMQADLDEANEEGRVEDAQQLRDDIDNAQVVDWVLYGGGIALAITGTVLLLLHQPEATDNSVPVSWQPVEGGSIVTFGFDF